MSAARRLPRWGIVLAGVLILVLLPTVAARLPTSAASISAADLLTRIQASSAQGYSGFAESNGGLALPVTTGQFSDLADLFGQRTQLRAWWRSGQVNRVDEIALAGETDTIRDPDGMWTWEYEANRATRVDYTGDATVRLPTSSDLLPPELGRRLLSQATTATRLGTVRVAGHDAAGLRIKPTDAGSTIRHVDVWADVATGLPLRVEVYGDSGGAVLSSSFLNLTIGTPSASTTSFTPPATAKIQHNDELDLVDLIDRFGGDRPPDTLAGLPRNSGILQVGAVGVYGLGVTELTATPVPGREASSLRGQLTKAVGVTNANGDLYTAVGPLSLLLTAAGPRGAAWLLVGTVTVSTLTTAAAELPPAQGFRVR